MEYVNKVISKLKVNVCLLKKIIKSKYFFLNFFLFSFCLALNLAHFYENKMNSRNFLVSPILYLYHLYQVYNVNSLYHL